MFKVPYPKIKTILTEDQKIENFVSVCKSGNFKMVKSLLEKDNSLINKKNKTGYSGLMLAAEYENLDVMVFLLEQKNLDINLGDDEDGLTALHFAYSNLKIESIKLLLSDKRIKIYTLNNEGKNASKYTKDYLITDIDEIKKLSEIDKIFNIYKEEIKSFIKAAEIDDVVVMESMLQKNPKLLNIVNKDGLCALMKAAELGQFQTLEFLLNHQEIEIDQQSDNEEKSTALHYACSDINKNNLQCIKILIEKGAKTDIKNAKNLTALETAKNTCDEISESAIKNENFEYEKETRELLQKIKELFQNQQSSSLEIIKDDFSPQKNPTPYPEPDNQKSEQIAKKIKIESTSHS